MKTTTHLLSFFALVTVLFFCINKCIFGDAGDPYECLSYNPAINYNFKEENPDFPEPTKDLEDCSGVAGRKSIDVLHMYGERNCTSQLFSSQHGGFLYSRRGKDTASSVDPTMKVKWW